MTIEDGYYAIPDPHDPSIVSYWRQGPRGLKPWPTKARYGPVFYMRDRPKDRTQLASYLADVRAVLARYPIAVREAIVADPEAARARFAELSSHCCICGRSLTDPASKTYGIGPECRQGVPDVVLARLAERMGRAHAASAIGEVT